MTKLVLLLRFDTFTAPLRGEQSVVGRSSYCSISLTHASISRVHASLVRRDGYVELRDLGSKNGTFLNGTPVGETPRRLELGDELRFGDVTCVFEQAEATNSIRASTARPPVPHTTGEHPALSPPGAGNDKNRPD